jgi:hypothetical protein
MMPRLILTSRTLLRVALTTALAVPALVSTPQAQAPTPVLSVSPGNGTMYIGGYPNSIWIIDEAKAKVVETIPLKIGLPRRMVMSRDASRFYIADIHAVNMEVVDVATRTTLETFSLSEGNRRSGSTPSSPIRRTATWSRSRATTPSCSTVTRSGRQSS